MQNKLNFQLFCTYGTKNKKSNYMHPLIILFSFHLHYIYTGLWVSLGEIVFHFYLQNESLAGLGSKETIATSSTLLLVLVPVLSVFAIIALVLVFVKGKHCE